MEPKNRASLAYRLRYAIRNPGRIVPYARRLARDTWLRVRARDHVAYYRSVMRSDTARSPYGAVGTPSRERWAALGRLQFDYLLGHGLKPSDRFLEIGCGNLRAGRMIITSPSTGRTARSTTSCARTSTTAPRRWSPSPRNTAWTRA